MKSLAAPFPLPPLGLAVFAAFAAAAGGAVAEETALQLAPVTVTGSRVEARSFELPYSVDVVDSRQIGEGQLKVNASEALAAVPGIVVLNRQNYAQDLQISSRGFGARSAFGVRGVKLIADGIPASNPDGQGQVATFNLDTAERMEVLRGPFSSIYGNHAGGVIQLFSRDGTGDPRISGGVTAGSWGTRKYDTTFEGATGPLGYVIDSSRFETDGYREHSAATRDQSFAKFTYRPDSDNRVQLVANSLHQKDTQDPLGVTWGSYGQNPRAVDPVANQFNTRKSIDHVQGGISWERRFGNHEIELRTYSGRREVTQYQAIPQGPQGNPRHSGGVVDFDRDFYGAGARWSQTHALGGGELVLTAGLDYDYSKDDRQGYENFRGATLGVKGNLRRDEDDTIFSFDQYLQALWKTGPWTASAGLRHNSVRFKVDDRYQANGDDSGRRDYDKTTPSAGLAYQLTPATNVYLSAARGFETPTLGELSYTGTVAGNTVTMGGFNFGLQPSRSRQVEAGVKSLIGEKTLLTAAIFDIRTDNEVVILASSGGRTAYQNASSTLRQGLELGLQTEVARNLQARLAFTQLRAVYDGEFTSTAVRVVNGVPTVSSTTVEAGKRLPGIPATSFYGDLAWTFRPGMVAAVEGIYRSRMYAEDTNTAEAAPAYAIANLRFTAEQKSGAWRFNEMVRFDNIFDRKYVGSVIVGDSSQRYYEPGTGFGWFAGMRAQYTF